MQVERKVLLNPGPATTTDTVKMAQVVPDICPREKEFGAVMRGVADDLVRIVHGEDAGYVSVLFCGSGTVCIDAAVSSLVPEGGRVLLANNGAYSKRAREVCGVLIYYIKYNTVHEFLSILYINNILCVFLYFIIQFTF